MRITVVGLGKIGLPLAVQYAGRGHTVAGADSDRRVVDQVNAGSEPFPGEHDLGRRLGELVHAGRLAATTHTTAAVRRSAVVVVVVPLAVDEHGNPDFTHIDAATADVARGLRPETLVIYETTLPVGSSRDRLRPMLQEISGLDEGRDFHLAFSPERVLTGRVFADLRRYPKLVGGFTPAGADRAKRFYESVLEFDERGDLPRPNGVWVLDTPESAEFVKLAETTYRDVNIALANQFGKHAADRGVDFLQVIEAANSQPYSHLLRPGIAVGGHCIPVYPQLYLWNDPDATVVRAAREANASMPAFWVAQAERTFGDLAGSRVAILGAAYRGGVKETALSGVFPLQRELSRRGAAVRVHDPLYSPAELETLGFEPYVLGSPVDVVVVQADHSQYRGLSAADLPGVRAVVDGRHVLDRGAFAGIPMIGPGAQSATPACASASSSAAPVEPARNL